MMGIDKKSGIIAGVLLLGAVASVQAAEEPKVEITSFIAAGSRTRAAELCGKVTGSTAEWLAVRVVVDPKTDRPGVYNTLVGKDGKFCTTVVSYSGQAEASIGWGSGKEVVSETAVLVKQISR
jgi:hypothetical protein